MDMWLIFLTLILLTRFSQRGSLLSGGGQWADHVPRGCSRLISISRRWGWARHLPGGWPDGGSWSTGGKWTQRCAALAHAPIPDLTWLSHKANICQVLQRLLSFRQVLPSQPRNSVVLSEWSLGSCSHPWPRSFLPYWSVWSDGQLSEESGWFNILSIS